MGVDEICRGISGPMGERARELATNLLFMEETLAKAREALKDEPFTCAYDNGGGQAGIRKNPAWESYNSLMNTYNKTLDALRSVMREKGGSQDKLPEKGKLVRFEKAKYSRAVND